MRGKAEDIKEITREIRRCGEQMLSMSQLLSDMFDDSPSKKSDQLDTKSANQKAEDNAGQPEKLSEKKMIRLEEVRAVLAEKSRAGFTKDVKELLRKHGAERLSAVDPAEFEALIREGRELGGGGNA